MSLTGLLLFLIIKKRFPNPKWLRNIFLSVVLLLFVRSIFLTFSNWYIWAHSEVLKGLLPPLTPITYFTGYIFRYAFSELVISLAFALLAIIGVTLLNKYFRGKFFYEEEKWLVGLGIISTYWPMSLVFVLFSLDMGIVLHFTYLAIANIKKKYRPDYRLSFLYIWLPVALLTLILSDIIIQCPIIRQFKLFFI